MDPLVLGFFKKPFPYVCDLTIFTIFFICITLLSGCSKKEPLVPPPYPSGSPIITTPLQPSPPDISPKGAPKRTIGLLLPLTGEHSVLGESLLKAIELSLLESHHSTDLVIQDTNGTEAGAKNGILKLFDEAPIDGILGPLLASEVAAITPTAWEKGVPVLSFSNAQHISGNNIFIMGYSPKDQVDILIDYAASARITSLLLIVPQSPYGEVIAQHMRQKIASLPSVQLTDTLSYTDPTSLADRLSHMDFSSVEAILIPEGGETLLKIVAYLTENPSYSPLKTKLLGSGQWEDEKLFSQAPLKGGIFPSTSLRDKEIFKDKFLKAFGVFPEGLAALGYDGIKALDSGTSSVLETILQPQGFDGADGHFSFSASGHIQRQWHLYEIDPSAVNGVKELSYTLTPVSVSATEEGVSHTNLGTF